MVKEPLPPHHMQRIKLGRGTEFALVDDADYPIVNRYSWHRSGRYASARVDGKKMKLHVLLLGKRDARVIDHKNRDGLDCQRANLHHVTREQNAANSRHRKRAQPFRGARTMPSSSKCEVRIGGSARLRFGPFDNLILTAMMRDLIALDVYKGSVVLNFPELRTLYDELARRFPRFT